MCAGDLTDAEFDTCEAIAWRLVAACVHEDADLWHLAVDEIRHHDQMDAVLEVLANTLAHRMVAESGWEFAGHRVRHAIAAALGRAG